jgi:hypothetical protein
VNDDTQQPFACPGCREDLTDWGSVRINSLIHAIRDPEGIARLELAFTCGGCGKESFTFITREHLMDGDGASWLEAKQA